MSLTTSVVASVLLAVAAAAQQPPQGSTRDIVAPGGILQFKHLKIALLATALDSSVATPHDFATIQLEEGGATEKVTVRPGESLNWHGYHVAIAAVHGPRESGGGRVELEVATVASLPQCIGKPIGQDRPWPCQ